MQEVSSFTSDPEQTKTEEDNENLNQNEEDNKETTSKKYGIGITGFDRITSPLCSRKLKAVWIICFLIFSATVIYQIVECIYQFYYAIPAVSISFVHRPSLTMPRIVLCPFEFFGTNPITKLLRKQYQSHFNLQDSEFDINFSDFLNLPNITVVKLWNMFPIQAKYFEIRTKCTPFKMDFACMKGQREFEIDDINTIGGSCVTLYLPGEVHIYGPVSHFDIEINMPPLSKLWMMTDVYVIGWSFSPEENINYIEGEGGMPATYNFNGRFLLEEIEEVNLNHPLFPCDDGHKVEACINACLEDLLYSQVTCRLPFMRSDYLEMCDTPEDFNKTFQISKKVVKKRKFCQDKCPRRCFEEIHILNVQISSLQDSRVTVRAQRFDPEVMRVTEVYWYTSSSLLADIGGSLGFFIDFTVLTLAEIIEICTEFCIRCTVFKKKKRSTEDRKREGFWAFRFTRRNHRLLKLQSQAKTETLTHWLDRINVGVVGCDRLSNRRISNLRKLFWAVCLFTSIFVCSYQISSTIDDFRFGTPSDRMVILKNESVKFPTLTICPYQPFKYSGYINMLFEEYKFDFNLTSDSPVALGDLIKLPDDSLLSVWNRTEMNTDYIYVADVYCKAFIKTESQLEQYNVSFMKHYTVSGKCLTMEIEGLVRYRGPSTFFCLMLSNLPLTKADFPFYLTLHSPEDDPRTLDPLLGIPLKAGQVGVWSINAKQKRFLNRRGFPCEDGPTVAKCRSDCYDKILEERTSCRLPFMRNLSLKTCDSPASFQQTMDVAHGILKNYSESGWCNCPRKCTEYIFRVNQNEHRISGMVFSFMLFQFPSNIILAVEEYNQMTESALFANICGSLGLFLGFSALTVLEIIEALFIFVSYKIPQLFRI